MSDSNSPGTTGGGDPGRASWPEYLGGEGQGAPPAAGGSGRPEVQGPPRRVIGTPSPAASRTLLAQPDAGDGAMPPEPFTPPEPQDPVRAGKAERIVVACFVIALLAGLGFLVAYSLIGVGSLTA